MRWSARHDGRRVSTNQHHRLVMTRSASARSTGGLSSLDCPSCGGELASSDDVACPFCKTALAGDARDWALASIEIDRG